MKLNEIKIDSKLKKRKRVGRGVKEKLQEGA